MKNMSIKIYDNIGAKFIQENNDLLIGSSLAGFRTLSQDHVNSTVPYLLKNKDLWETGLGLVKSVDGKIYVERSKVVRSSNNDKVVDFTSANHASSDNHFYVFANEFNFDTNFNRVISINDSEFLDDVSSTYLVELSGKDIELALPKAEDSPGLCLEFKTSGSENVCRLLFNNKNVSLIRNSYCKIVSDGNDWIELIHITEDEAASLYISGLAQSNTFTTQADPVGQPGSLQYNNGGTFAEAPLYVGLNKKLLLGQSIEESAHAVLPTSGNFPTVFNNQNRTSDFIVKGSGDKNLFFGYEGRLGLNIPEGARPQTSLHILTNSCQEGIRLENRNQCYPANITLYHKPNSIIQSNSTIGTINLSAKNSSSNQVDYVQLLARSNSYTANAAKGEFAVRIEDSNNKIEALKINSSGTFISNNLYIGALKYSIPTTSGNLLMSDSSGNIVLTSITNTPIINLLDGGVVSFTGVCT